MNLVRDNCLFPAETEENLVLCEHFCGLMDQVQEDFAAVLVVFSGCILLSVGSLLPVVGLDLVK